MPPRPHPRAYKMKLLPLAAGVITFAVVGNVPKRDLLASIPAVNVPYSGETTTAITATTTNANKLIPHDINNNTCQWTVIMGDSNNRNSYFRWLSTEQQFNDGRILIPSVRGPLLYDVAGDSGHRCEARWSDQEMLILIPPKDKPQQTIKQYSCHVVTSKFSFDQRRSLQRYVTDIHNTSYCGSELSDPFETLTHQYPTQSFTRPSHPDMYWFSNGLWSIGSVNRSGTPFGPFCEERFAPQVEALKQWQATQARVVWQSLFPINQHEHVNNKMLEWDYRCQKYVTHKNHIEIVDIYEKVQTETRQKVVTDYHLTADAYDRMFVNQYLDKSIGGWEAYRGVTLSA